MITLEDGKKAIVKNVIPGQKVSFSINKIRKGRGEFCGNKKPLAPENNAVFPLKFVRNLHLQSYILTQSQYRESLASGRVCGGFA